MRIVNKYIKKQIVSDKIFVLFLGILSILTPLSYFFVQFSIDGNLTCLNSLQTLTSHQILYRNALLSNKKLAAIFLLSTSFVTVCVTAIFFYRILRANQAKLGALLGMGHQVRELARGYATFIVKLGFIGGVIGTAAGYFLADVLIQANQRSYQVTGLIKQVSVTSILIGMVLPVVADLAVTYLIVFMMFHGKEAAILMTGKRHSKKDGMMFRIATRFTKILPVKEKFPYRIALRKPISLLIMVIAILVCCVFLLLGQSLRSNGEQMMLMQQTSGTYNVSAMICQISGIISGVLLLFLALFLNFQDNKKDMEILRLIGYRSVQIRKIFVNVYWSILMTLFLVCLLPSILIAKGVLQSLSMAIGEKMTFYMNFSNILRLLVVWNIVYLCVKWTFMLQLKSQKNKDIV